MKIKKLCEKAFLCTKRKMKTAYVRTPSTCSFDEPQSSCSVTMKSKKRIAVQFQVDLRLGQRLEIRKHLQLTVQYIYAIEFSGRLTW